MGGGVPWDKNVNRSQNCSQDKNLPTSSVFNHEIPVQLSENFFTVNVVNILTFFFCYFTNIGDKSKLCQQALVKKKATGIRWGIG